jgi:hypothetical protein
VPATEDAKEAALALVDVATLCELKGVNRFWRALSRRVLCSRLCRGRGHPAPTHLEAITDLDVELLIEAGRPGDTALAGRMLPGLARLHGYGFVVDVAKVRAANLGVQEANHFGAALPPPPSLLRGFAKAALESCISGDGEAPLKLTIAAVACAGSGVVCRVPVQHMREDTMPSLQDDLALFEKDERGHFLFKGRGRGGELNLCNEGLQGPAAMLISYLIPSMGELTVANLLGNHLDEESAKILAEVAKQKGISLCGIRREQTTANFSMEPGGLERAWFRGELKPPDAILLASDLSQAVVTGGLTEVCETCQPTAS